ncbi:MAG: sulfatase-like hydrolase/transferase [Mariniphaga sp.]
MRKLYISLIASFLMIVTLQVQSQEAKNVLFIAVDDLRAELNCYGSTHMHTPNIDQLASDGMLFTNAYTQQAICTPSRISMLTGLRPATTGIYKLDDKLKEKASGVVSMPKTLKNSGYYTISLGKIYHHQNDDPAAWTEEAWRPKNGTDGTWYYQGYLNSSPSGVGNDGSTLFGPPTENMDVKDNAYQDGVTAEKAMEKLEQYKDQQFFLAVGFKKPHLPFTAPKKYWDLYDRNSIEMPVANAPDGLSSYSTTTWGELRSYYGMPESGNLTEEQTKELIHGYRACVSYIDAQVGKVLNKLNEIGLREKTIVIFWSDHGYKLGEYGDWCKHTNFEVDVRIPFIIDVPGMPNGLTCNKMVESVDVFPTVVDLFGMNTPSDLDGMSLKTLLKNPLSIWKSAAFSQYPRGNIMGTTVRNKDYRYTEYSDKSSGEVKSSELYKHANNTPLEVETINLVPLIGNSNNYGSIKDQMQNLLNAGWNIVKNGTSIKIKETTAGSVKLGIYNVGGATDIKLIMKEENCDYHEIMPNEMDASTKEITISGLETGKRYSFKLQLVGDDYKGNYSNEVTTQLSNEFSLIKNGDFSSGLNESWKYNNNNVSVVEYSLISRENDDAVLQAEVSALGNNFWDVGIINLQENSFHNETVHISFYAQSSVPNSNIRCGMQSRTAPSITRYQSISIGTNWEKHELDINITADLRNDWQFKFFFDNIATYQVDSLKATIKGSDDTQENQWEIEADQRIQNLRKGDFTLKFVGSDGNPITAKSVNLKMVKHQFNFGSVMKLDAIESWSTAVMLKYFNTSVVSNEFKWSGMQPTEGPVNYTKVNNYLDWSEEYELPMKGHVLIWGGTGDNDGSDYHKLPKWVREKSDGTPRTESEIEALCKTRVQETVDYYKDRINIFDVLNESTSDHADWLQNTVGNDINWKVFQWARDASADADLLINDYGILSSGSTSSNSKVYEYSQQIKSILENAPGSISAIGCQGHFGAAIPTRFYDNISYLHNQTGLPIHITEFDLKVDENGMTETKQAEEYCKALKLAFSHPNVDAFIFWGFSDANHWRDGAGIFNENKTPKEAADSVYNLLHKEWTTIDTLTTNSEGEIFLSAFYGTYEIEIVDNDVIKMIEVDLTKANEDSTIVVYLENGIVPRPKLLSAKAISENQIKLVFSKEMNAASLDVFSFLFHADEELQVSEIQISNDGLSVIMVLSSNINSESYATISCIKNTITAADSGVLDYFGPKEIGFDDSPATGIESLTDSKADNNNQVKIYHYPNTSTFQVLFEETIQKIDVYDINGRLLMKNKNINQTTYSFNSNDFPKGVLVVVVNEQFSCKVINL